MIQQPLSAKDRYRNFMKQIDQLNVPDEYWVQLQQADRDELCQRTLARSLGGSRNIVIDFLGTEIRINPQEKQVFRRIEDDWIPVTGFLVQLLTTLYLMNAQESLLTNDWIGVRQLQDAHFFQGPHALNLAPVVAQFGHDPEGFASRCTALGGVPMPMADVAFRLKPFPRIPLVYLLWKGDEEFPPRLSVLFDRSIERHFAADAIWGLVNLMTDILVRGEIC